MKNFYLLVLCLTVNSVAGKVLVITHSFNRPDFIEIQHKTFKKFLKDDYEFVVFNDAERNKAICNEINNICNKLGIRCIQIPQAVHDKPYLKRLSYEDNNHPCCRCANVVQYSLDILGFDHDDIVAIIDSDMFLVKEFSIAEYLSGYDIAGQPQSRADVHYLWNGIMFFNMNTLPNKKTINCNCGIINNQGCDVGGYLYYYFKENPSIKIKYVNHYYIESNNTEYFIDKTFFHYRGGGNWDHQSRAYHKQKTKFLHDFINNVLAQ